MKRLLLVIAFVLLIVGTGAVMRTPITQPGFDNIPTMIDVNGDAAMFANSAAEQAFYTVSIPRNALGLTDRLIFVELPYVALNSSGFIRNITWRVYYGTSIAVTIPVDNWSNSGTLRSGKFVVWLSNKGATNSQQIFARDETVTFVSGLLSTGQDSRKTLDLRVTIQFSLADPNLWIQRQVAITTQMAP